MTRQLKFKAITEDGQVFVVPSRDGDVQYDVLFGPYGAMVVIDRHAIGADEYFHAKHVLQYTGLKDKSKTEWCEGDVICIDDPEERSSVAVIEFDNGRFVKRYRDGPRCEIGSWDLENFEVIGCIHLNPELMEEKQ